MLVYRVHGERLECGNLVPPSTHFAAEAAKGARGVVGERFRELMPRGKPQRSASVFAFEERADAECFISTKSKHFLYKLEIDTSAAHRGDWKWLGRALADRRDAHVDHYAKCYWEGRDPT